MTLLDDYNRVTRARRCPICQHSDWCLISRDDPPTRAICARTMSPSRWGEAGWLHRLRDDGWRPTRARRVVVRVDCPGPGVDFGEMATRWQRRVDPTALRRHAGYLGLTVESLQRLGIGWNGSAWAFPMSDLTGRVRGIRLRFPDARKLAVVGGREGLFIPAGLDPSGVLLVAEGPTDTASLLDVGFNVIGRPSCGTGVGLVLNFVRAHKPRSVVIIADADEPGQRGAARLAAQLLIYGRDARVVTPPAKDARAWVSRGATHDDVARAINAAHPRRLVVSVCATRRSRP